MVAAHSTCRIARGDKREGYHSSDQVPWDERARTIRCYFRRVLNVFATPITPAGKGALLDEFVIGIIGSKPQREPCERENDASDSGSLSQ